MGAGKVLASSLPCEIPAAEWRSIITLRPNILVNGSPSATGAVLDALNPYLRRPLWHWDAASQFTLPSPTATVILYEVVALNTQEQKEFLQWLTHLSEPTQVVSTSSSSLYALVQGGTFSAALFYRLNMLVLDC